jgi:hypothetical protein
MSSINIHDLLTSLAATSDDQKAFRQAVLEWTGSPDSKKKSSRKSKAKTTEDGAPKEKRQTAWNAWIESCCGKKGSETAEFLEWKEEQGEMKGNIRYTYASRRKHEDLEAYKEFETKFKSSTSSAASGASAASAAPHDSEDESVAELEVKPAKKASKGKKAANAKSDTSDAETAVVIEAKPAKKAAAKPKKAAKKPVSDSSDSE